MSRSHEAGIHGSDPSPLQDYEEENVNFYWATILSDVEECSEPSSPDLSTCNSYEGRQMEAIRELQVLIRHIIMEETDITQVAEDIVQFSERKKNSLLISGEDELFSKFGVVPQCFTRDITKLMIRIKALGKILALRAHKSHIKIVPYMLERARFDLKKLKLETFSDNENSSGMEETSILGEEAFQELEESLFERFPMSRQCFDIIKSRDGHALECLCWNCILRFVDVHLS